MKIIFFLPIFSIIFALILAFLVLFRNYKNRRHQIFSIISFCVAFWIFSSMMADLSRTYSAALFWAKLAIVGPSLISFFFLYFSFIFPFPRKVTKQKLFLLFIPILPLLVLTPSRFNIQEVKIEKWGTAFTPGPLYIWLLIVLLSYMGWAFYNLGKSYYVSSGIEKTRIKYLFWGAFFTLIIGMFSNLILPLIGESRASVLGPSSSLFFLGFVSYAITRYRLMDIKIALGKTFVFLLSVATVVGISFLFGFLNRSIAYPFSLVVSIPVVGVLTFFLFKIVKFYESFISKYFYPKFVRLKKQIEELEEKLTEILDLKQVSSLICEKLKESFKLLKIGVFSLKEKSKLQKEATFGIEIDKIEEFFEESKIIDLLSQFRKPLIREEVVEETFPEEKREKIVRIKEKMENLQISAIFPLFAGKEFVGVVIIGEREEKEAFSKEEIDLLTSFFRHVSIAFKNALLFHQLKEKKEELEKFYKLTVGRELRMIELKKKIKELEEKLKKKQ